MKSDKLELTCIDKENRHEFELRILIEDPTKSYHTPFPTGKNDIFDNRLIFSDDLLAPARAGHGAAGRFKALEQEFTGRIKSISIDPPYSIGSAFTYFGTGKK